MRPFSSIVVLSLLVLLALSSRASSQPSAAGWVERSNENAQLILTVLTRFNPEFASQLGVEGFDTEIIDLNPGIVERVNAALRDAIAELKKRRAAEQDPSVRQDLDILIKSAEDNIRGNALSEKYQIPYFNMAETIFSGLRALLDDQVPAERRQAALARLTKYAGMEEDIPPITELAADRTRERLNVKGLLGPVRAEVEKSLANEQFYIDGIAELFQTYNVTGYENAYTSLKSHLASYRQFVEKEVLPRTREDFRLPPELYAFTLEQVGVEMEPAALARTARAAFTEVQGEMQKLAVRVAAERGWPSTDYREVIRGLKKEQLVGDSILPFYKDRIAEIENIIRRERLVTLPGREMRMRIASPAEAAATPAPNMRPPRLLGNTGEMGEFILPLNVPPPPGSKEATQKFDDFTFAAASWTLTAHEGRPGHEMQFASIIEKGVSVTRAIFAFNSANVEGWGLYSEAIMRPFMPADGELISLQFLLARAARAFLDPELQMGTITPEEAFRILRDDVVLSEAMANQEVERYTFRSPGQATAYFYGYIKLQELRSEVTGALGEKFDQLQFHDFILAQGLLPPPLVRDAVMKEFVAAGK